MINYKWYLFGTMGLFLILDIIGESFSMVAVFIGWLIGLMTKTEWDIENEETDD